MMMSELDLQPYCHPERSDFIRHREMKSRSRRTPGVPKSERTRQGILTMNWKGGASENALNRPWWRKRTRGPSTP
jgi:hypothetical protein